MSEPTSVLIVGAGLIGFATAYLLGRHGISRYGEANPGHGFCCSR
ncbi:FAD-dependent monooxygenase [Nocardia sp. NPDC003979]